MNTELNMKIKDILESMNDIIKSSLHKKRYKVLQEEILMDEEFIEKQSKLRDLENNVYDNTYIELKNEILSLPKIKAYNDLEDELFCFNIEVNNLLRDLLPERKGCK